MGKRAELHEILCGVVMDVLNNVQEPDGDRHVYYNPPESIKMKYPAIVYNREPSKKLYANNAIYKTSECYEGTIIDYNPDSYITDKIESLPFCTIDRYFKSDNLYHTTFRIYY